MNIASQPEFQRLTNRLSGARLTLRRGFAFGIIILTALLAFEIFNFSTTDVALRDVLGDLTFMGVPWATILAVAFCGIDFAGIARLFSPDAGTSEANEAWYLFGAWLLAATMNAILTWWGVSMAVLNHQMMSSKVIDPSLLVKIVPVFVAIMVWLIRILLIGSLSYASERLFGRAQNRSRSVVVPARRPSMATSASIPTPSPVSAAPKPVAHPESVLHRAEPAVRGVSMHSRSGHGLVRPPETHYPASTRR